MTFKQLPSALKRLIVLMWAGTFTSGVGILGFIVSFQEVAGRAQVATDVHETIPVMAYVSIALFVVGILTMWIARKMIAKMIERRQQELADRVNVQLDED